MLTVPACREFKARQVCKAFREIPVFKARLDFKASRVLQELVVGVGEFKASLEIKASREIKVSRDFQALPEAKVKLEIQVLRGVQALKASQAYRVRLACKAKQEAGGVGGLGRR